MELFPHLEIGWLNGWVLLAVEFLIEGFLLLVFPKNVVSRLFDRSGWERRPRGGRWSSMWPTAGRASRLNTWRMSSSVFTRCRVNLPKGAAMAWAYPLPGGWWKPSMGRSPCPARPAKGQPCRLSCQQPEISPGLSGTDFSSGCGASSQVVCLPPREP